WQDFLEEIRSLIGEFPRLREVVAVNDEGFSTPDAGMRRHGDVAGSLDDEALIVYTSGTTGPPKGVVLTARNLLIDADGIADWHGFRPDDRLMCVLPLHPVNGTVVTLVTPVYFGGGAGLNRKF